MRRWWIHLVKKWIVPVKAPKHLGYYRLADTIKKYFTKKGCSTKENIIPS